MEHISDWSQTKKKPKVDWKLLSQYQWICSVTFG